MNIVFVTCVAQPAFVATVAAVTTVAVQLVDTVAVHTLIRSTLVDICEKNNLRYLIIKLLFSSISLCHTY